MHMPRIAKWLWRSRQARLIAVALVVLLSYAGLHALAAAHADSLTVTVHIQPWYADPTKTLIFSSTATGEGSVEAAQAAINDTPTIPPNENFNCTLGTNPPYFYDIAFRWHGLLVETAHMDTMSGCSFWRMSILGLPNLLTHLDGGHNTALCALRRLTGMPFPERWNDACVT